MLLLLLLLAAVAAAAAFRVEIEALTSHPAPC
jgi:hypothetical protein